MTIRLLITVLLLASMNSAFGADRPNVLFIAVDDLRPELACYGKKHIHSPNIDRLAASGVLFERAYCMVPTCGASRASLMTGIRPTRNRFVNYLTSAQKDAPASRRSTRSSERMAITPSRLARSFITPKTTPRDGQNRRGGRREFRGIDSLRTLSFTRNGRSREAEIEDRRGSRQTFQTTPTPMAFWQNVP